MVVHLRIWTIIQSDRERPGIFDISLIELLRDNEKDYKAMAFEASIPLAGINFLFCFYSLPELCMFP